MLKGNLSGFSLGEILQSLAINRHTGTLTLSGASGEERYIYFENGDVRFFSHGTPRAARLGEMLVRAGHLTQEALETALRDAQVTGQILGSVLLEKELVSQDDLRRVLQQKISDELYELFCWTEGDFEFHVDACPEDVFDPFQKAVPVTINTNSVIMEGLRRQDEWGLIAQSVRSAAEIFAPTGTAVGEDAEVATPEHLRMFDGATPVGDIAERWTGSRFEFYRGVHELVEAGALRRLELDEALAAAREARRGRDSAASAVYLRYATLASPEDPALFSELGDVLAEYYQEDESKRAYLQAVRLYFEQGDWDAASELADKVPPNASLEVEDLQMLLQLSTELRQIKKALWVGNQLATTLQRAGETQEAAEVLDSLLDLDPSDLNLKIQIASLFQQVGETERAIGYYDEVCDALEGQKKIKDQIKILKVIADLDPTRQEIRQKIATLIALQEKLERLRKRRLTVGGVSVILGLIVATVPLVYEIKARGLFRQAEAHYLEEKKVGSLFSQSRPLLERVVDEYGLSSQAAQAREMIAEIETNEGEVREARRAAEEETQRRREKIAREKKERIEDTFRRASAAEAAGDYAEAHRIIREAPDLGADTLKILRVRLPILLRSDPAGAAVEINGSVVGKTPFSYRYSPGETVKIKLSLRGCESVEEELSLEDQHEHGFTLSRRSEAEFVLPSAFDQPLEAVGVGDMFVFPSQDGHVYAYDPKASAVVWQLSVGKFGDRLSPVHSRNKLIYVGTVDDRVLALNARTGKRRWISRDVRGPFQAPPVTSPDFQWVAAANLFGEVFLLDNRRGSRVAAFRAENEVVAAPIFVGKMLLVGSRDSHVYGLDLTTRKVRMIKELTGEIDVDPVAAGDRAFFATSDGRLHSFDASEDRWSWSTRITEEQILALATTPDRVVACVSSGSVVSIQPERGTVEDHWRIADGLPGGMTATGDRLFVGFEDGSLVAWDTTRGEAVWRWEADASIRTPPLVLEDKLYVACSSGTVQALLRIE